MMTSAHTSLAAARAPARSPPAALLQIDSTLAFTLACSVGSLWMIDLHTATASATPAAVEGVGVAVDGVEADVDVVAPEELVLAPPALLGAATEVLWLLDVELLLPQPARIMAAASAIRSHAESFRIIGPPSLKRTLARRGGLARQRW